MEFEPTFSPETKNKENEEDKKNIEEKAEELEEDTRIEEIEKSNFPPNIKMNLLLTVAGEKPAFYEPGFIDYKEVNNKELEEKRENIEERMDRALSLLEKLELPTITGKDKIIDEGEEIGEEYWIIGGKDKKSLERLKEIHEQEAPDLEELGKAFGFPETAARAFSKGQDFLAPVEEVDQRLENEEEGLSNFLNFRLSKDHFDEELEFVKRRKKLIKKISPDLYKEIKNT